MLDSPAAVRKAAASAPTPRRARATLALRGKNPAIPRRRTMRTACARLGAAMASARALTSIASGAASAIALASW